MKTRTEIVTSEGFSLSRLIWRLLKRQPAGYAEKVLDANPGLAALGPHIPVGAKIVFPLEDISPETKPEEVVRLWD